MGSSYGTIILENNLEEYQDFSIESLYVKNDNLSIEQVSQLPFDEDISNRFAKGYVQGAYWFKFHINNLSEKANMYYISMRYYLNNLICIHLKMGLGKNMKVVLQHL